MNTIISMTRIVIKKLLTRGFKEEGFHFNLKSRVFPYLDRELVPLQGGLMAKGSAPSLLLEILGTTSKPAFWERSGLLGCNDSVCSSR